MLSLYVPAFTLTELMPRFCAAEIAALMAVNSADPSVATVSALGLKVTLALTDAVVDDTEDIDVVEMVVDEDCPEVDDEDVSTEELDCAVTRLTKPMRPIAKDLISAVREANGGPRQLVSYTMTRRDLQRVGKRGRSAHGYR